MKNKDTAPEITLRKALWKAALRYRINFSKLPGRPDVLFEKEKLAIFVHGCFWHSHPCRPSPNFRQNQSYWKGVLSATRERDQENVKNLVKLGYSVVVIWECEINSDVKACVNNVIGRLHFSRRRRLTLQTKL